jgi:DNA-binding NtrC family response regulator
MPEMHGPQLVHEIQRVSPSTRAILMSGYVGQEALPALPVGVPFLPKPFSPQCLVSVVKSALAAMTKDAHTASAQARDMASEAFRQCRETREAARHSKEIIRQSRDQLARQRKGPAERR